MSTSKEIKRYISALIKHDWMYAFADDYSAWLAGRAEWSEIAEMQKKYDKDYRIFNEYAPPNCRVKVKK